MTRKAGGELASTAAERFNPLCPVQHYALPAVFPWIPEALASPAPHGKEARQLGCLSFLFEKRIFVSEAACLNHRDDPDRVSPHAKYRAPHFT